MNLQVDTDQLASDRVSEERKSEYFQKLYSLLRRAPKESNLSSEISGCSLETTNYLSEKSLISRDLVTLPELDSGINISTTDINKTNFNNVSTLITNVVTKLLQLCYRFLTGKFIHFMSMAQKVLVCIK